MSEFNILGIVIVGGVFGIGFLVLGICEFFSKTHRTYIPKPPMHLHNKKRSK